MYTYVWNVFSIISWPIFQEVELLLQQLAAEQKEVDTLREYVFQERMDIAKETEHVTSLARVSIEVTC